MAVKRNPDFGLDDLSSDFDPTESAERSGKLFEGFKPLFFGKKRRGDFFEKERPYEEPKPLPKEGKRWFQDEHGRQFRQLSRLAMLDAYQRHKEIINLYYLYHPGANRHLFERDTARDRTDYDVLKDNHKFLWNAEDEAQTAKDWEKRLAKRYYDKLFKEYCIVDLSQYKHGKIGMRWRTEPEVKEGKGQFRCGSRKCEHFDSLTSWEVNFKYVEDGQRKDALVKVRLCPECSDKLNYVSKKKKVEKTNRLDRWRAGSKSKKSDPSPKREPTEGEGEASSESAGSSSAQAKTAGEIWSAPQQAETERTVEHEIDDFLNDIFD